MLLQSSDFSVPRSSILCPGDGDNSHITGVSYRHAHVPQSHHHQIKQNVQSLVRVEAGVRVLFFEVLKKVLGWHGRRVRMRVRAWAGTGIGWCTSGNW